ncbi:MAG: hypothetical protein PHH40_00800 [Candidatus Moranbacteria bacterium]|nr:hypothetical protein [Candidatus Moranbacteria bacterium]MDD3964852.1 hypothetical protein [Candidatus Moranbacteria bacterium]
MKKYPEVTLVIDVEKDIENATYFLKYEKNQFFRDCFFRGDLNFILSEKFSKKEQGKVIEAYVRNFFKEHKKEIEKGLLLVKRDWKKKEKKYLALIEKMFRGRKWLEGEYRGIVSIFRMYPRWIEQKTFFFPYAHQKPGFANGVIAHEMLHFFFFDYIFEKYGLKEGSKIKGKESDYIWKVSEVFNVVMENWKPYTDIIGRAGKPYPGQEKMYKKMQKQWFKNQDIDWLLDQWLQK